MKTINIFASVDVKGILDRYLSDMISFYGFDPTGDLSDSQLQRFQNLNLNSYSKSDPHSICRLGYLDYAVAEHTRLTSSKDSTIGWKLDNKYIKDGYLTTAYQLAIAAKNNDRIRWWGHTISPGSETQVILSNVDKPGSSTQQPQEFTHYKRTDVSFLNPGQPVDPTGQDLAKGVEINTRNTFCVECTLNSTPKTISYDVELLLLSKAFMNRQSVKYMSYPIAKIVVDPTIVVKA